MKMNGVILNFMYINKYFEGSIVRLGNDYICVSENENELKCFPAISYETNTTVDDSKLMYKGIRFIL